MAGNRRRGKQSRQMEIRFGIGCALAVFTVSVSNNSGDRDVCFIVVLALHSLHVQASNKCSSIKEGTLA